MKTAHYFVVLLLVICCNCIPCAEWILLGTGNPNPNGRSGTSNLLRYGDSSNGCNGLFFLIDVGRGAVVQLSKVDGLIPNNLTATFITHYHSDHMADVYDLIQTNALDAIPAASPPTPFVVPKGYTQSEIEDSTVPYIPEKIARLPFIPLFNPYPIFLNTFDPTNTPQVVYTNGPITVEAVFVYHAVNNSCAYRFNTPAGSFVFGGDGLLGEPFNLRTLSEGADVVIVDPFLDTTFLTNKTVLPPFFPLFHSNSTLAGQMCRDLNTPILMLTHLMPGPGDTKYNLFGLPFPFGPVTKEMYAESVKGRGGFRNKLIVGDDLLSVKFGLLRISGFVLVDTRTQRDIRALNNGDVLDVESLSPFTIRVNLGDGQENVDSVTFTLNDRTYHKAHSAPYTITNSNNPFEESDGIITIGATANSNKDGGISGAPSFVTITVHNSRHGAKRGLVPQDPMEASASALRTALLLCIFAALMVVYC